MAQPGSGPRLLTITRVVSLYPAPDFCSGNRCSRLRRTALRSRTTNRGILRGCGGHWPADGRLGVQQLECEHGPLLTCLTWTLYSDVRASGRLWAHNVTLVVANASFRAKLQLRVHDANWICIVSSARSQNITTRSPRGGRIKGTCATLTCEEVQVQAHAREDVEACRRQVHARTYLMHSDHFSGASRGTVTSFSRQREKVRHCGDLYGMRAHRDLVILSSTTTIQFCRALWPTYFIHSFIFTRCSVLLSTISAHINPFNSLCYLGESIHVGDSSRLLGMNDARAAGYSDETLTPLKAGTAQAVTLEIPPSSSLAAALSRLHYSASLATLNDDDAKADLADNSAQSLEETLALLPRGSDLSARRSVAVETSVHNSRLGIELWEVKEGV